MSQQINLYNPLFRRQQTHFSLAVMLQGLGLILAGSMMLYAYAVYQVSGQAKQLEQSASRLNEAQSKMANASAGYSPGQANELVKNEVQQLEKKLAEVRQLSDMLSTGLLGNATGYSEYMRAFSRQVPQGLWLTGFRVTAAGISLDGGTLAPELVPAYIQKLSHESVMRGKNFSSLQIQPAKDAKHLEFTLYSTPDDEARP